MNIRSVHYIHFVYCIRLPVTALILCAGALPLAAVAQPAAQAYPNKAIRMIVTFPAGGGVDFMGRIIGQKLSERIGQQVVIDNRGGSNGIIGLQALMASPADGYTIASSSPAHWR